MEGKIKEMFLQEPLKSQGLTLIGMGSDKVVFETQGSTRKIVKVSSNILQWKVENLLAVGNDQPVAPESVGNGYQKTLIDTEKQEEKDTKEIFGKEHFLRRGVFRIKIPITNDFWKTKNIDGALLMARTFVESSFLSQIETLQQDKRYRTVLTEIVTKLIIYSKKTGLPVDIFTLIISLYTRSQMEPWIITCSTSLMPGSYKNWGMKMSEDPYLHMLQHYYVYYYALNSAAKMLGIEENIKPDDLVYFKEQGIPTGDYHLRLVK